MQGTDAAEGHTEPTDCLAGPQHVARAREATTAFLDRLDPRLDEAVVQDLVLLVSELVTNSMRHAGGVTSLRLRADQHNIQVTVEDPSPLRPQARTPDLDGEGGGFGWPLILQLAHTVTIQSKTDGGKSISVIMLR
ncbi:ATP-binding protein [Streptomyces roseus]|uniref:ATP-binding protein n=1 Tax=Streptomyces roseus TaxID=66430 RepID=UPI0037F4E8A4